MSTGRRLYRIPLRGGPVVLGERTLVMGILNVTPDSFAGGAATGPDAAVAHGLRLFEDGADWVDVGGESTRPGAEPVAAAEELRRVVPVVEALRRRGAGPISVDTTKAEVARAALDAGADMVNDVSGFGYDPAMAALVASRGVPAVLMHLRGGFAEIHRAPAYRDVMAEVAGELAGGPGARRARGRAARAHARRPRHRLLEGRRAQPRDAAAAPRARRRSTARSWSAPRARASSAACSTCRSRGG